MSISERTCEACGALDNQTFKLSEREPGVNYPTIHPNCRCVTIIGDFMPKTRLAKDPLDGHNYKVDGSMTYEQWKNSLTPEQKESMELHVKQMRNSSADKAQYERYKNVLGTENIKSLEKFIEIKYTNVDKWTELKKQYNNVRESRADELFYIVPPVKGDAIKAQSIFKELNKSEVGKSTLEFIQKRNPHIEINYTDECPPNTLGQTWGNNIEIYAKNTQTVLKTTQTLIHEVTHMKYDIGGNQWSEAVCFAQEIKHLKKELTFKDKRDIIKTVKRLYPEYSWRK